MIDKFTNFILNFVLVLACIVLVVMVFVLFYLIGGGLLHLWEIV